MSHSSRKHTPRPSPSWPPRSRAPRTTPPPVSAYLKVEERHAVPESFVDRFPDRGVAAQLPAHPYVRHVPDAFSAVAFSPGGLVHFARGAGAALAMACAARSGAERQAVFVSSLCGLRRVPALVVLHVSIVDGPIPACRECLSQLPAPVVAALGVTTSTGNGDDWPAGDGALTGSPSPR